MTTDTAVTMQDLELEHAELLPSRETLNTCGKSPSSNSVTNVVGSFNGNTNQSGILDFAFLNGDLNGNTVVLF